VFLARTAARWVNWRRGGTYRFFDPSAPGSFTSHFLSAQSVIPGAAPLAVTADAYSVFHRLVLIEQTSTSGDFRVYSATSPTGPWTLNRKASGRVSCAPGLGPLNLCRALIGHPELSKSTELLLSFYDPHSNHDWVTSRPW